MALFKKRILNKNQNQKVFDPTKTEIYTREYDTFLDALNGEIGLGSQDAREITFDFGDDRVVKIYSIGNNIINLHDPKYEFNIGDRVYWSVDFTDEEKNVLSSLSTTNDLFNYNIVRDNVQEIEELNRIYYSAALENFLKLSSDYKKGEVTVRSKIIEDKDFIEALESTNFFKSNVETLVRNMNKEQNLSTSLNMELGITYDDYETILFTLLGEAEDFKLTNSAERLIIGASENNATLADVKRLSGGFTWGRDILNAINTLQNNNYISINTPNKDSIINISLPDIPMMVEEEKELNQEEFAKTLKDVIPYLYIDQEDEEVLYQLVDENLSYEEKNKVLKDEIEKLQKEYNLNKDTYETKKIERSFADEDSDTDAFSLEEIFANDKLQNENEDNFFKLEKLEKKLVEYNIIREGILTKILEVANKSESSEKSSIIRLAEQRIKELRESANNNIAFTVYDPEEVKDEFELINKLTEKSGNLFSIEEDPQEEITLKEEEVLEDDAVLDNVDVDISSLFDFDQEEYTLPPTIEEEETETAMISEDTSTHVDDELVDEIYAEEDTEPVIDNDNIDELPLPDSFTVEENETESSSVRNVKPVIFEALAKKYNITL